MCIVTFRFALADKVVRDGLRLGTFRLVVADMEGIVPFRLGGVRFRVIRLCVLWQMRFGKEF